MEYNAGPRHIDIMVLQLGFGKAKVAAAPRTQVQERTEDDHIFPLDYQYTHEYRTPVLSGTLCCAARAIRYSYREAICEEDALALRSRSGYAQTLRTILQRKPNNSTPEQLFANHKIY